MQRNSKGTDCIRAVHVTNSRSAGTRFDIEPWGEQFEMPAGSTFVVVANAPEDGALEVELADDHIAIYGWAGSSVAVFHNGVELGGEFGKRPPPPPTPRKRSDG